MRELKQYELDYIKEFIREKTTESIKIDGLYCDSEGNIKVRVDINELEGGISFYSSTPINKSDNIETISGKVFGDIKRTILLIFFKDKNNYNENINLIKHSYDNDDDDDLCKF